MCVCVDSLRQKKRLKIHSWKDIAGCVCSVRCVVSGLAAFRHTHTHKTLPTVHVAPQKPDMCLNNVSNLTLKHSRARVSHQR